MVESAKGHKVAHNPLLSISYRLTPFISNAQALPHWYHSNNEPFLSECD